MTMDASLVVAQAFAPLFCFCLAGGALGILAPFARALAQWGVPLALLAATALPLAFGECPYLPLLVLGFSGPLGIAMPVVLCALAVVAAFKPGRAASAAAAAVAVAAYSLAGPYTVVALGSFPLERAATLALAAVAFFGCMGAVASAGRAAGRKAPAGSGKPAASYVPPADMPPAAPASPAVSASPAAGAVPAQKPRRKGESPFRYTKNKFFVFCVVWAALLLAVYVGMAFDSYEFYVREYQATARVLFAVHAAVWVLGDVVKFRGRALHALGFQLAVIARGALLAGAVYALGAWVVLPAAAFAMPFLDAFVQDMVMLFFVLFIMPVILACVLFGLSGEDLLTAWGLVTFFKDDDGRGR